MVRVPSRVRAQAWAKANDRGRVRVDLKVRGQARVRVAATRVGGQARAAAIRVGDRGKVREAAVMDRPRRLPAMVRVMVQARICPCLTVDGARLRAIEAPSLE